MEEKKEGIFISGRREEKRRNFYLWKVPHLEWGELECVANALVVLQPRELSRRLVLHTLLLLETKPITD